MLGHPSIAMAQIDEAGVVKRVSPGCRKMWPNAGTFIGRHFWETISSNVEKMRKYVLDPKATGVICLNCILC